MQENGIFSSVPLDLRSVGPLERFESMELLRKMFKILIFVLKFFSQIWVFIFVALSLWLWKAVAVGYCVFQYWDIKSFYNQVSSDMKIS